LRTSHGLATGAAALLLFGLPLAARADLTPGIGVGTTGLTLSLGTPLGNRFDARIQYGSFSYGTSISSSDNSYKGQLQLHSFMFLADYHPFASTFALTTGLCLPNFSLGASLLPNADGSFTLNHVAVTGISTVGGTVVWNKTAPYLGIAWQPAKEKRGLSFAADLGAAFVGTPNVHLFATGAGASNPVVQSAIAAETQSLENSTSFNVFPIVNIGLVYRFGAGDDADKEPTPNPTLPSGAADHGNEFVPTK
jgi:hypothetical protein